MLLDLHSPRTRKTRTPWLRAMRDGASAKRVLSNTTALQMAYPMVLLGYMYGLCMLFGGMVYPQVLEVRPSTSGCPLARSCTRSTPTATTIACSTSRLLAAGVTSYYYGLKRWTGALRNWMRRRSCGAIVAILRPLLIVALSALLDSGLTLSAHSSVSSSHRSGCAGMSRRWSDASRSIPSSRCARLRRASSRKMVDRIADAERRDNFVDAIKSLGRTSLDRVVSGAPRADHPLRAARRRACLSASVSAPTSSPASPVSAR
jgi:hypothetical protein